MQDERDVPVTELIDEFLAARAMRKPSVHTLAGVPAGSGVDRRGWSDRSRSLWVTSPPASLRAAFARFAADRAPASVARAWSSWNAFFTFLVTEQVVAGQSDVGGRQAADAGALPQAVAG